MASTLKNLRKIASRKARHINKNVLKFWDDYYTDPDNIYDEYNDYSIESSIKNVKQYRKLKNRG